MPNAHTLRVLAGLGINDSPASRDERLGLRPAAPQSEERIRRVHERKRRTPDAARAEMRAEIAKINRLLADPENDWRRDVLELARGRALNRYRLAISSLRALPALPLPKDGTVEPDDVPDVPSDLSPLAADVGRALSAGRVSILALAARTHVSPVRIVAALDELEIAGVRLHRTGPVVEIDPAAEPILAPQPVRMGTAIAGVPVRAVPNQRGFYGSRMRRASVSLDAVAARLAELGVRTAVY